eukprot:XP_008676322.1 zinc finger protein AZF3-like [Zea mays]
MAATPALEPNDTNTSTETLGEATPVLLCHRTFSSGQALGGYKTSHWKPPPLGCGHGRGSAKRRALGGHKRLHYEKDKDKGAARTNQANTAVVAIAMLRDFDLNLSADDAPPDANSSS